MNFDRYVNRIRYPRRSDFSEDVEAVSTKGLKKTVTIFDEVGYNQAVKEYRSEEARIKQQFCKDLLEELNLTGHPKAEVLLDKAWEYGRSEGCDFQGVARWAHELAELLS